MDPTTAAAQEGSAGPCMEGVCKEMMNEALGRLEATLQAAVSEVHVDINAFKQRMEQRVDEACKASGPLAKAVSQMQQENQQLREQLEGLARLVEGLAGAQGERSTLEGKKNGLDHDGHGEIQPKTHTQSDQVAFDISENTQPSEPSSTASEPSPSSPGSGSAAAAAAAPSSTPADTPAPPPWRVRSHTNVNVSIGGFDIVL